MIERHKEADERRSQVEFIRQEYGNKSIVYAPDDTHAKEAKAKQENLAVVEFHIACMFFALSGGLSRPNVFEVSETQRRSAGWR